MLRLPDIARKLFRRPTAKRCLPSQHRTQLAVTALEDRTVPSLVFSDSYTFGGWGDTSATVTVTVRDDVAGYEGQYFWNYNVANDDPDNFWDYALFALPGKDPNGFGTDAMELTIGNMGSSQEGWESAPYGSPSRPLFTQDEYIWWGDSGPDNPILPGGSADMWFTTVPTTITSGTGIITSLVGGFANTIMGTVAAPTVPDPHIVTTKSDTGTIDDGVVSLREAVEYTLNHQDKGTDVTFAITSPITLDPDKDRIALGDGTAKSINILGPQTIQRSGEVKTIFSVPAMATVGLNQLTLSKGKSNNGGGALISLGALTITSCTFSQNEAAGGNGGAINVAGGTLTINGTSGSPTLFTGNSARWGGAIYIAAGVTANINSSAFVLNSATTEGGAIFIESSSGQNYTTVTLADVDVNGNVASGSRGGGIMVSDSTGAGTSLRLVLTQIRNNIVSGANSKGGGLFFGAGVLDLLGVTFEDNDAESGDGLYMVTGTEFADEPDAVFINDSADEGPF